MEHGLEIYLNNLLIQIEQEANPKTKALLVTIYTMIDSTYKEYRPVCESIFQTSLETNIAKVN